VQLRILVGLAALACFKRDLLATSCSVPPPCARVRIDSVLFVGMVVDAGVVTDPKDESTRDIRFQVDEVFAGLSPGLKEVMVTTKGSWLEKGHSYLIDAARGDDNHLYPTICGTSGEVTDESIAEVLDYLRQRVQGKAKTSLAVSVTDQYKPVPDVDVTITTSGGSLTRRTGADGIAIFDPIKSAKYRVVAAREHYRTDTDSHTDEEVDVLVGTCATALVALQAEAAVGGFVRDAKGAPVASFPLELISAPENSAKRLSLSEPFFEVKTSTDGRFLFESVSPGRYFLGSNVEGLNTSPVPPTYYPGQRTRDGAVPIDVKLGETVDNLLFTLPDFGGPREIQVCVVDENGKPVPSAGIASKFDETGGDFASLGEKLTTNETGCIKARGYTRVAYAINAIVRPPGDDIWQIRLSDSFVINPGEEPVHQVLVLQKAISLLKPKQ
jgi:hypothetical protein